MGSMADVTLEPGRLARFDCRIVAYPEPTITWLKDGKTVRHCDHTQLINCDGEVYSLLIRDVTKDDNGLYTCLAVNKFGEARSEALLNVIDLQKLVDEEDTAPSFVTKFYDVEVLENVPADFQCLIKGRPFPKVQWLLNGRELQEGPELMMWVEGNQARMAIRHAKLDQSGEVTCRISNALGEATHSAQLVVVEDLSKFHAAPVFSREPHDVEVNAGEDVTFECAVQGLPTPEVTWHFRARELFESKRRIMESDGDTHRLTLRDVVSDNAGEYVIKASNIIGDATCRVRLLVHKLRDVLADLGAAEVPGSKFGYAPSFTRRLQDLRGTPGSVASLECRVIGVPDPVVTWEKDGKPLVGDERVQVSCDSSTPSVTILSLQPEDTGEYTCLLANDSGKTTCTGRLRVQAEKARPRYSPAKELLIEEYAPPAKVPLRLAEEGIPDMPQDKPVILDVRPDSVRLKWLSARAPDSDKAGPVRYVVEGRQLPDSRWMRLDTDIPGTSTVLRGLKPAREYDFRVRAETKLGSSQPTLPSTLERREVKRKPVEVKAPPVLPSLQPYITDMGAETVRLAWRPAESPVTKAELPGVSYRLETQKLPSEEWVPMATRLRSPSYYIPDLPPDRDYMVRVRAENEYGVSEPTAPIWLPRARAFPGVPVGRPRIVEMGEDAVRLSWQRVDVPATQADEEPLLYMVEMQGPPFHTWRTIAQRVPSESYLVTDLEPATDYRFRVRSQTPDGRISEPSPATSVYRTLATTRVPVDELRVEEYEPEDEAVTLSWQRVRIPPFHRDEDTLLYMLEYQEPAIDEWRPLASGLPTTRYRVPDIGPTQDFRFRVRGLSPHGVSPPSYPAGLYRSVSPMRPIAQSLEISDLEPESLRLSWRPSETRAAEPLSYLIEGRELPSLEWRPLARDVQDTSYRLSGLRPSTDYAFRVSPLAGYTAGLEPSPPVSLTSLPVLPRLPASSLTLREAGPDAVELQWQPANLGVYSRRDTPIFYTVEQAEVPAGAWTPAARRVPRTSYTVAGLRPDRDYRFRVRPETDAGPGDYSLPVLLHRQLAGSLPLHEPIISDVTGDSLLLTWQPVRFPRGGEAEDVSYNVEMLEPPGSYWLPICTGLRATSYRVRHLNPDRDYMFRVSAVSERVDPTPTPGAYLARRAGPPKLPREAPFVSDLQPDSLTLNWRAVDLPSRITDYSPVTYRLEILDSPLHAWRTLAQGITRTQHHVTGLAPDMDFSFRIRAENEFGLSEPTDILLVRRRAVPPHMPREEPMISDVRPSSVRLSWRPAECPSFIRDHVPTSYSILVQEPGSGDGAWRPLVRGVPTTSYHVTGLDPDRTYLFCVQAQNEFGTSAPSPHVQLRRMPDFKAPVLLPEIEDVEPSGLRLSWRPRPGLSTPAPSLYSLETYEPQDRTWRALATRLSEPRYRLTDLAPSRDYLFRVRPELDSGPTEPSYPLLYSRHRVAPRVPVERPQLSDIAPDSVRISWMPVRLSAYERPPTSLRYQLEQRDLPHGSWHTVAPRLADHSHFLHGLKPHLDYAFRVRVVDDEGGVSEPSIPVYLYRRPVIPSLPLERPRLEPLEEAEAVRLRWNRVSVPPFDFDEDDLTFMIEAQRLPEQDWRPLARGVRDTQHRLAGLDPRHNYHFRVRGESSALGLSMPSSSIPYYRRPVRANVPITYPSIEDVDTNSARLRWRPVYMPPYLSPSTTYSVEVQEPPRREWRPLASDVPQPEYLVSDLAPRRDYLFRIRARSPAGDLSEPTAPIPYYKGHLLRYEPLPIVSMRPLALEAFTPTRIYIDTLTVRVPPHLPMEKPEMIVVNPESVRLTWKPARVSAATASLSPISYRIEARVGPSLDWQEMASGLVGQGHLLTDLNPHMDYCFRVRAVNEFGDSEPTMPVYLYRKREFDLQFFDGEDGEIHFGPEIPTVLPKMPIDTPKIMDVTREGLTLRWKPGRIPLYAEKVPITYNIEMCEAPSATWRLLAADISNSHFQVTGLNPESDYNFRVRAVSLHGPSEPTLPAALHRHPRASVPRGPSLSRMSSERDVFPQLPKMPYVNVISSGVPPRVPQGRPLISGQTEECLTLTWNPARLPSYMKPTPITYTIEVKEPPGYLWSLLADKVKETKYLVTDLRPEQDYMFRIRAENEFGRSEPTLPASLIRQREEPRPEPRRSVSRDRSMTPRRLLQRFASVERSMEREPEELVGHTVETSPSEPEFLAVSSDSIYGAEGQPVKISLRVRGYPPPRVSWYVKGEKVDIGDRYDSYITPTGQVVLEFENMSWDDVGEYKAYAENEHGTATKVINLLMADPPTFVEPLKDLVLVYQESGKLEARVDGIPYPTIRWTKDWRPLGQTSRVKMEHEGDYWALSIEDAIPTDDGLYACVAENAAGKALCSARVYVEDKLPSKADMVFKDSNIEDYYYILEELGRGRHGVVRRLIEKTTGHEFVGKFVRVRSEADKDFFKCELEALRLVNHKNVLHVQDAYETPKRLITVSELVSGEELLERAVGADSWTESDMAYFVHQLLEALSHMHLCGVAHLDIKPANILLAKPDSDEIKLIDFGFARKLPVSREFRFNYGSPEFASPEAVKDEAITMAADMWSVGVLTYILLSGLSPFRGASVPETLRKVKDASWKFDDKVFADVSKEAKDFISKLLVPNPESRLTVAKCLEHPWIKMAVKRGQGLKISTARLRQYLNTSKAEREENAVRVAAQLRSLRSLMEGVASEAGLLPITDPESGQVIFPDSEAYGEFLDDETWYDWQSRYQYGPDTQLLPLHEADYTARVRGYRRSMSRSLPPDSHATMKERRLMSDIDREELPPSLEKELEYMGRRKEEPDSKRSSISSALGEPGVPGPIFREHLRDIAFVPGETVVLYCQVAGDPPPTTAWYRNEELLTEGPRLKTYLGEDGVATLTLTSAKPYDIGVYKCVARSKTGRSASRARVMLGDVPERPGRPVVVQVSSEEALVIWDAPRPRKRGNSDILYYKVDYKKNGDSRWTTGCCVPLESALVGGLSPNSPYRFRVCCVNKFGPGAYSWSSVEIHTRPAGCPPLKVDGDRDLELLRARQTDLKAIMAAAEETEVEEEVKEAASLKEDVSPEKEYELGHALLKGHFFELKQCKKPSTNQTFTVKVTPLTSARKDEALHEFDLLRDLRHDRIIRVLEGYKMADTLYLICERLCGDHVVRHLSLRRKYSEECVARIIRQLLAALQWLQHLNIVHLNLQPASVLMESHSSYSLRLADFSRAIRIPPDAEGESVQRAPRRGYPDFIPPEVVGHERVSFAADIWGVGNLAFLLLSGQSAYGGVTDEDTLANVAYNRYDAHALYENATTDSVKFIFKVMKRLPRNRPTLQDCLEHKWLQYTDHSLRTREDTIFLSNKLRSFANQYDRKRLSPDFRDDFQTFVLPKAAVLKPAETADVSAAPADVSTPSDVTPIQEVSESAPPAEESAAPEAAKAEEDSGKAEKEAERVADDVVAKAMDEGVHDAAEKGKE